MRGIVFVTVVSCFLVGCISRQELVEAGPRDDAYCKSIGTLPGTEIYAQCRLQLRKDLLAMQAERRALLSSIGENIAATGARHDADRAQANARLDNQLAAMRSRSFNCTSSRFGDTINTSCQ